MTIKKFPLTKNTKICIIKIFLAGNNLYYLGNKKTISKINIKKNLDITTNIK